MFRIRTLRSIKLYSCQFLKNWLVSEKKIKNEKCSFGGGFGGVSPLRQLGTFWILEVRILNYHSWSFQLFVNLFQYHLNFDVNAMGYVHMHVWVTLRFKFFLFASVNADEQGYLLLYINALNFYANLFVLTAAFSAARFSKSTALFYC